MLTAEDVSIIELLELDLLSDGDDVTKCERESCGAAAVNMILHSCCGFSYPLCAPHTGSLRGFLEDALLFGGLRCLLCDEHPAPSPSIRPYNT